MNFEWDEVKNRTNLQKHGLDFFDAWEIFESPVLVARDTREDYGEDRYLGVGFLRTRVVVFVFTERNGDTIRMISLRRAKRNEREKFFKFIRDRLGPPGEYA
jgi:uncharacterized DUF497 family protein